MKEDTLGLATGLGSVVTLDFHYGYYISYYLKQCYETTKA